MRWSVTPLTQLFHCRAFQSSRHTMSLSSFTARAHGLVDFDCNLLHKDLYGSIEDILKSAEECGVTHFVVPGCSLVESAKALDLSERCSKNNIWSTAGVHPYNVQSDELNEESLGILERLITGRKSSCLAVGECGLDYSAGFPAKELQMPWFRAQVSLALKHQLPLYLHVRDARADFTATMAEFGFSKGVPPPVRCVVHCFTGTTDELQSYVDMGFYIGLTGFVVNQNSSAENRLRQWVKIIPRDRLVLETDAPYMSFKDCRRGEASRKTSKYPNVPSALPMVVSAIAEAGGGTFEDVAEYTVENTRRFLGILAREEPDKK